MRLVNPPKPVAVRFESLGRLRQGLFDRRTALTFIESKGALCLCDKFSVVISQNSINNP